MSGPGAAGGAGGGAATGDLRPIPELAVLRRRLALWYAATLGGILLLLGAGLFVVVRHQLARQLDDSLRGAAQELIQAARVREEEAATTPPGAPDEVDELHIPDRTLFLLDTSGAPVKPDSAGPWIRAAARRAARARAGVADVRSPFERDDRRFVLHAERFRLGSGRPLVAVAVGDEVELTDRYAALIAAFGGAALAAVVLVAVGGSLLVGHSTAPVERSVASTRRFMADAAHELRTPVSVVRTRAEVALRRPRAPDADTEALAGIARDAQRLGRIVDELLMLARADAGVRPTTRARLYLDDAVLDALDSMRPLADAAGVRLTVEEFEEAAVVGDAVLLRELVIVLVDNAIKFTPDGGAVRVRVRGGPTPALVVEDTGRGIPPDQLPLVFERFYRGEWSRAQGSGAGLGLSIARWIADEHGAVIALDSTEGQGTRAEVRFPRSREDAHP